MGKTQLDYMEYANDAAAQAAYVSSDTAYGSDILAGGIATADSVYGAGYEANKGNDDNLATRWTSTDTAYPHWWKYDLGVAVTKVITKLRINKYWDVNGSSLKDFTLQGSNNDSDWDTLHTDTAADAGSDGVWEEFTFLNSTAYRYYKINCTSNYRAPDDIIAFYEIEGMETVLQCYSEDTIKEQGTYSLKGIAVITESLNDTLTRTVDPTIDLTDLTQIKFDIRGSRTGSQIKIGIHDSGGTTTEHTANIAQANVWQTETWDISSVSNANKDAIDSIIITIVNADATNVFYIDNMYAEIIFEYVGTGSLTYSGSGIYHYEAPDWEYAGSGTHNFSGAGLYSLGLSHVGIGTYNLSGVGLYSLGLSCVGSGIFTYSGKAVHRWGDWAKITKGTSNFTGVEKKGSNWTEIDKEKGDWKKTVKL